MDKKEEKTLIKTEGAEANKPVDREPPVFDDDFGPDRVWKDDGTTSFADMDLTLPVHKQKHTKRKDITLSKKEVRAVSRAAFAHYFPAFISIVVGFGIVAVLMYLWL